MQKLGSVLENITNKIEPIEIGAKKDKKTTGGEKKRKRILSWLFLSIYAFCKLAYNFIHVVLRCLETRPSY